jgi:diguanylate cyclase (GGDEF)-like protein/PAS domain S-box-containing protein
MNHTIPAPSGLGRLFGGRVAERRRAAAALKDSQDTVQALLDATTETALLIDLAGRIIALNETACERLRRLSPVPVGDTCADLIGVNVFDLFPDSLRAKRKARNDEVIASAKPARFEDERNGQWMDNSIYPVKDPEGRVVRLAIFSYDITARKKMEQDLERALRAERERATHDALTGVLNHGAIVQELRSLLEATQHGRTHVIVVVDVDGLKQINDNFGHQAGDAALVAVADCLREKGAIVGRYGGDEFVVVLPNSGRGRGDAYVRTVLHKFGETMVELGHDTPPIQVRGSIGFSVYPDEAIAVRPLIELADTRMYAAKRERPFIRPRRAA